MTHGRFAMALVLFIATVIASACASGESSTEPRDDDSANVTLSSTTLPLPLVLESLSCDSSNSDIGFVHVTGMVHNPSTNPKLDDALAVGSWFTGDGTFIAADDALLEFNPVMPGQSSQFKTYTDYNPMMEKCNVRFRTILGQELNHVRTEPTPMLVPTTPPYPDVVNQTQGAARNYRRIIENTSCRQLLEEFEKYQSKVETDRYPALSQAFMDGADSRLAELGCATPDN